MNTNHQPIVLEPKGHARLLMDSNLYLETDQYNFAEKGVMAYGMVYGREKEGGKYTPQFREKRLIFVPYTSIVLVELESEPVPPKTGHDGPVNG